MSLLGYAAELFPIEYQFSIEKSSSPNTFLRIFQGAGKRGLPLKWPLKSLKLRAIGWYMRICQ
jgi:hypothetical protein